MVDLELTAWEKRILLLLAEGKTDKQIAAALNMRPGRVGNTLRRCWDKLPIARNRQELGMYYISCFFTLQDWTDWRVSADGIKAVAAVKSLSPRQRQIMELLVEEPAIGYAGVAERFSISGSTVKTHMERIFLAFGLPGSGCSRYRAALQFYRVTRAPTLPRA